jgi:membrane protease YdiL (CAAX protease family)
LRRFGSDARKLNAILVATVCLLVAHTVWNEATALRTYGDSGSAQDTMRALAQTKAAYRPEQILRPTTHPASPVQATAPSSEERRDADDAVKAWRKLTRSRHAPATVWRFLGITLSLFDRPGALDALRQGVAASASQGASQPPKRHNAYSTIAGGTGAHRITVAPTEELACWQAIYGNEPIPASQVPPLRRTLSRLDLGWFERLALARLYVRAGMTGQAVQTADRAARLAHWSGDLDALQIGVLLIGALCLFSLGLYLAAVRAQRDGDIQHGIQPATVTASVTPVGDWASPHAPTATVRTDAASERPQNALLFPYTALMQAFLAYLIGQPVLGLIAALALSPARSYFVHLPVVVLLRYEMVLQLLCYVPILGLPLWILHRRIAFDPATGEPLALRGLLVRLGFRANRLVSEIGAGAFGYLLVMPAVTAASLVSEALFSHFRTPNNPADLWMLSAQSAPDRLLVLLVAAVAAPLAEETMFRGILYPMLRGKLGIHGGVVLSAAIFAILHPTLPGGFLPIWAVGAGLALVYEWRRSLLPCVVLHGLFNGFITLSAFAVYAK